jgi:hypothetical protein
MSTPDRIPDGIARLTVDWSARICAVERDDGILVAAPLRAVDPNARLEFASSTYDVASDELTIRLLDGSELVVQVGFVDVVAPRPVVYLDQTHWITLARSLWAPDKVRKSEREPAAQVIAMAQDQALMLPLAGAHVVETSRADGRWRRQLAETMVSLSRGWQMRDPLSLRREELAADMARSVDRSSAPNPESPAVFTLEPWALFATDSDTKAPTSDDRAGLSPYADQVSWISSLVALLLEDEAERPAQAAEQAERWARSYQSLAAFMREARTQPAHRRLNTHAALLSDLTGEIARAALTAGLSEDDFARWLDDVSHQGFDRMPYLGHLQEVTFHRLSNADDRWEPNDLHDMHYLACAAGYADVVVGERKTTEYLRRSRQRLDSGARLCRNLSEAVEFLDGR